MDDNMTPSSQYDLNKFKGDPEINAGQKPAGRSQVSSSPSSARPKNVSPQIIKQQGNIRQAAPIQQQYPQRQAQFPQQRGLNPLQEIGIQISELKQAVTELQRESDLRKQEIKELSLISSSGKDVKTSIDQPIPGESDDPFGILSNIPEKSELQAELPDLLQLQYQHNGSDMHLKVGAPPMIRIEGELVPVGDQSLTSNDAKRLILPLLTNKQKNKLALGKDIDFSFQEKQGRFRTNVYLQRGTIAASLRLVKTKIPSIEELGIPESIKQALSFTNGLFLLTGPTGSGKSTSMAAMVEYLNNSSKYHIITLEDPIEYIFQDKESVISQREVGIDTESYAEGMRAALRQDPDVIILGELRDQETTLQALKAAETGHLVISTLHSPNSIQTIGRILDMFQPSERMSICATLAETLNGILSHKLIPSADMEKRVLVPEIMYVTSTIASLIRTSSYHEIYQYVKEGSLEGMITFNQSFIKKLEEGLINEETALAYSEEPNELNLMIKQNDKIASNLSNIRNI